MRTPTGVGRGFDEQQAHGPEPCSWLWFCWGLLYSPVMSTSCTLGQDRPGGGSVVWDVPPLKEEVHRGPGLRPEVKTRGRCCSVGTPGDPPGLAHIQDVPENVCSPVFTHAHMFTHVLTCVHTSSYMHTYTLTATKAASQPCPAASSRF